MNNLSDEMMIEVLMYLRAAELAILCETNKEVFSRYRISRTIRRIVNEAPASILAVPSPFKKHIINIQNSKGPLRPETLYAYEAANILIALSYPQPLFGKGYWISASWASNAKKFFEGVPIGDIVDNAIICSTYAAEGINSSTNNSVPSTPQPKMKSNNKNCMRGSSGETSPSIPPNYLFSSSQGNNGGLSLSTGKRMGKTSKIRKRRGSDALPPWPNINAELTCMHNGLSSHKVPNAKRRAIASSAWHLLRKYYPIGASFPVAHVSECSQCLSQNDEAKQAAVEKKESILLQRKQQWCPSSLHSLNQRGKAGVPTERLSVAYHGYLVEEAGADGQTRYETVVLPPTALFPTNVVEQETSIVANSQIPSISSSVMTGNSRSDSPLNSQVNFSESSASAASALAGIADTNKSIGIADFQTSEELVPETNMQTSDNMTFLIPEFTYPLICGTYYLISRDWVKYWRRFLKDVSITQPPATSPSMDCTRLLCNRHGHLLVPTHLEEYLVGMKRSLLAGLGDYLGEIVEVVTADEWETLQHVYHQYGATCGSKSNSRPKLAYSKDSLLISENDDECVLSSSTGARSIDFSVSFAISQNSNNDVTALTSIHQQLHWNLPVCHICDPLELYREENVRLQLQQWRI